MDHQHPHTNGNSGAATPELLLLLGRIDGKLDLALTNHAELAKRVDANDQKQAENVAKVQTRVAHLEKRQSYFMGAIAVLAAAATHGFKFIFGLFTGTSHS